MTMTFGFVPQTFFLILGRVLGVVGTVPFFGGAPVPPVIRLTASLAIALLLTPAAPAAWATAAASLDTPGAVVLATLSEVLLGAAVGLICEAFLGICAVAGEIGSQDSGLYMANNIDPLTEVESPMISQLVQLVFVVIVLSTNAHLVLLKLLAESFRHVPPQFTWLDGRTMTSLLELGATVFSWGVRLAAPLIATALLLNAGLGLISRMAPEFDILFLSLPVRLFVGLAMLGMILRMGAGLFEELTARMLEACAGLLT